MSESGLWCIQVSLRQYLSRGHVSSLQDRLHGVSSMTDRAEQNGEEARGGAGTIQHCHKAECDIESSLERPEAQGQRPSDSTWKAGMQEILNRKVVRHQDQVSKQSSTFELHNET